MSGVSVKVQIHSEDEFSLFEVDKYFEGEGYRFDRLTDDIVDAVRAALQIELDEETNDHI